MLPIALPHRAPGERHRFEPACFSKLESLELKCVDFMNMTAPVWVGECPSLADLSVDGAFQCPFDRPFLGQEEIDVI